MIKHRRRWALLAAAVICCAGAAPPAGPQKVIARIDLSKPFHLTPGASFTATQGPEVPDPNYYNDGDKAPDDELNEILWRAAAYFAKDALPKG